MILMKGISLCNLFKVFHREMFPVLMPYLANLSVKIKCIVLGLIK